MDRTQIPPNNWLQFDSKNQEFYGIPMASNVGRAEYQLVRFYKYICQRILINKIVMF